MSSEIEYRHIRLSDIKPSRGMDFAIYLFLPANKKYIQYIPVNEIISPNVLLSFMKQK